MTELIEQAIDLLHLNTGTGGNAALAGGFDEVRFGAFQRSHAVNDALLFHHFFFGAVQIHVLSFGSDLPRHFVHQAGQATHLFHLQQLRQKIVQVKAIAAFELGRHFLRRRHVDVGRDLFNQGHDVAHAQHATGVAVCIKGFETINFFAGTGKLNGRTSDLPH